MASNYEKLVEALRHCAIQTCCDNCPMYDNGLDQDECVVKQYMDAAAAIEELTTVLKEADKKQAYQHECICELTAENEEFKDEVKRLQDKLCDWCSVCPKERRNPDDCELLGENPVMYGPSGAKMEVQE